MNLLMAKTNQAVERPETPTFLYVLYVGIVLFFLFKVIKGKKIKSEILGVKHIFKKPQNKWVYYLGALILGVSVINLIGGEWIMGILMIVLAILAILMSKDESIITPEGIYDQGDYLTWDSVQKWAFDTKRNELVLRYKQGYDEKYKYIKVRHEDIENINTLIRKYKLNK